MILTKELMIHLHLLKRVQLVSHLVRSKTLMSFVDVNRVTVGHVVIPYTPTASPRHDTLPHYFPLSVLLLSCRLSTVYD